MKVSNLDLLNACDSFPYLESDPTSHAATLGSLYTLLSPTDPQVPIGYLTEAVFNALAKVPIRLKGEMEVDRSARTITVFTQATEAERSAAVKATVEFWREKGTFKILEGWRNELYPCYGPGNELLWNVERSASSLFGIATYGVHLTAFTRIDEERMKSEGTKWGLLLWIPRRSLTKETYPGMLDNTVAGGMASGEDAFECVIRESEEEASLPADIVRAAATAVGSLTYIYIRDARAGGENGLIQPECEFVYELPLSPTTIPKPNDTEVQEFCLLTIEKCQEYLAAGEFKPNCSVVMLDFFIRHGVITKETEGEQEFVEIEKRLHRDLGFPGPWK